MKLNLKLLGAAVAIAGLWSSAASANTICALCEYTGGPTYIGTQISTTFDISSFGHSGINAGTSFTDIWVFDFAPSGSTAVSANFAGSAPPSFSPFSATLYSVSATCPALTNPTNNLLATSCSSYTQGAAIVSSTNGNTAASINYTPLVAGKYAFVVIGTAGNSQPAFSYTGQLQTNPVPEPGSIALVGLALCAAGATLRKRKAA